VIRGKKKRVFSRKKDGFEPPCEKKKYRGLIERSGAELRGFGKTKKTKRAQGNGGKVGILEENSEGFAARPLDRGEQRGGGKVGKRGRYLKKSGRKKLQPKRKIGCW